VDVRGTFPEHLFGLEAAELPPPIVGWMKGLNPYYQAGGITIFPGVSTRAFYHYWNGACRASERHEPRLHPTQKPVALMRWAIGLFPGTRTLVDPYAGVGSTLVAAKQLGLKAIGIEWDEQYCRAAAARVEAATRLLN
jgi:hypothetical protein